MKGSLLDHICSDFSGNLYLVTGGSGFLGSHLIPLVPDLNRIHTSHCKLLLAGAKVRVMCRSPLKGSIELNGFDPKDERISYEYGSVAIQEDVSKVRN